MVHDYTYDLAGRLHDVVSDGPGAGCGGTCADHEYAYNRAGMRLAEASSVDGDPANGTAMFAYDAAGRLVDYAAPGAHPDQAYGWSEVLDRTSRTVGAATVTTTFDAAHRPTSDSAGGAYAHDGDGRLTAMPGRRYAWDGLGRLTTVRDGSGTTISTYTYDALDRLRDVTSGGRTVRHRYVGTTTQLAQLQDVTAGASVRRFANTPEGEAVASFVTPTTGRRYHGTNGHGDVTWGSDGSRSVVQAARYDPWGVALATTGGAMDLGFQGSWRDPAAGHYWAVARWYRPSLGRFVSEDELLGEPQKPPQQAPLRLRLGRPGVARGSGRAAG